MKNRKLCVHYDSVASECGTSAGCSFRRRNARCSCDGLPGAAGVPKEVSPKREFRLAQWSSWDD